jgi:hypothetical protein
MPLRDERLAKDGNRLGDMGHDDDRDPLLLGQPPMKYSDSEKYACAKREVEMRRRVYPRWIEQGKIDFKQAAREIAIMEEIAFEYRERLGALDLFDRTKHGDQESHAPAAASGSSDSQDQEP